MGDAMRKVCRLVLALVVAGAISACILFLVPLDHRERAWAASAYLVLAYIVHETVFGLRKNRMPSSLAAEKATARRLFSYGVLVFVFGFLFLGFYLVVLPDWLGPPVVAALVFSICTLIGGLLMSVRLFYWLFGDILG